MANFRCEVSSGGGRAADHAPAWCVCRVLSIQAPSSPGTEPGPTAGPGPADGSLEPVISPSREVARQKPRSPSMGWRWRMTPHYSSSMAETIKPPRPAQTQYSLRFMWWLIASQKLRIAAGATVGTLWMVGLALPPYLLARAIDDGLRARDLPALVTWVAVVLATGALLAILGITRHRTMTKIRNESAYQMVEAIVAHSTRMGAALSRRVTAGEVVTIGMGDVRTIGQSLTVTGPGVGAVIAYVVVAVLLLSISPILAVIILTG